MKIPLGKPFLGDEEKEAVASIIDSRRLAVGDTVGEFEKALAERFQKRYCVCLNSGTTALYLGIKALGVKRVAVPALTCDSVLHAVLNAGASVIFADVEEDTHNIDPSKLSEKELSDAEAIVVTHTYGHAADMDKLDYYLEKYKLVLIEDFAQATGGYFRNRPLGSFGRIAVTSFYAPKGLATGHGGAVFTDDEELYRRCVYGRGTRVTYHYRDLIPLNLQMTDIQAAIGLVQLGKLDLIIEMRNNIASKYSKELSHFPVSLMDKKDWAKHAYYKYAIMLPESIQKQAFIKGMNDLDIEVGSLYDPPLHKREIALEIIGERVNLPVAERLAARTISLPMFPELLSEETDKVCQAISMVIGDLGGKSSAH